MTSNPLAMAALTTTTTATYVMDPVMSNSTSSEVDHGAPTHGQKMAVVGILSVLSVFGTVGNALVLYVFSSKGNKVTSTIFILALAWTDVFTCSVIIPLTIAFISTDQNLGLDLLCKLYQFLITFNVPLAAFIMVAIAVDRYFSICHPFLHAVTPRRARITVFFLCIFAFLLGTITALGYGYVDVSDQGGKGGGGGGSSSDIDGGKNVTSLRASADNFTSFSNPPLPVTSVPVWVTPGGGGGSGGGGGGGGSEGGSEVVVVEAKYQCHPSDEMISLPFLLKYQKFYASFYLLSLLAVLVIYAIIYRSVVRRREWRRRQRSSRPVIKSPITIATDVEEFELRTKTDIEALNDDGSNNNADDHGSGTEDGNLDGNDTGSERDGKRLKKNRSEDSPSGGESRCLNSTASQKKASKERRDFNFLANIRTAGMLFVVSVVFIVSFLPAWLMAVQVLDYHIVVFYLYFVYNVANPVIYAFMNHAFRKELKRMLQRGINFCRD